MAPNLLGRGEINGSDTLAHLMHTSLPLGVVCNGCLHRALIDVRALADKVGLHKPVRSIKFRCTKCRRRDVEVQSFWSPGSVRRFMRPD